MMTSIPTLLSPPATTGHLSLVRITDTWYIACRSKHLKSKPLARKILGIPLVVFRTESGRAAALLDRCPHRNVPLSRGDVTGETLRCGYHGWQFDTQGQCKDVPGLCARDGAIGRPATAFPTVEQDGYVWVYADPSSEPQTQPFRYPCMDEPGYTRVQGELEVEGTLHATLENILDVPHTAFLHRGLFRSPDTAKRNPIKAIVRRYSDRVEAEFVGEPRPPGVAARILSPSGGEVQHWDRFMLPSVAQVEYKLGSENHVLITQSLTPVEDFRTIIYSTICLRLRIPGWLIRPVLTPIAWRILGQDAKILKLQTESLKTFGGEQFGSTEIDLLGSHIFRLLKAAEKGEVKPRLDECPRDCRVIAA